jgi:hypothetical protein
MHRKAQRGFSFVEFMMVATVVSFVGTGVKSFVFDRNNPPQRRIASNVSQPQQLAGQGRASVDQMVRELELAGNAQSPTANNVTPNNDASRSGAGVQLVSTNSTQAPGPFLVAEPHRVVFEADLDGDNVVERVEYRLNDSAIERRVAFTNPDGSTFTTNYEVVTGYVDNAGAPDAPLFRYGTDPYSGIEGIGGIRTVWITLQLRPPADPTRPQFRTLRFDGVAQRRIPQNTAVAGLK